MSYFRIMNNFGKQWETDKEKFNEVTGVIERERTKLRVGFCVTCSQHCKFTKRHSPQSHIVPISTKDLTNPHTAFYCTQNPGWRKVCTIYRMSC